MSTVTVQLDDEVIALLHAENQPVQRTVREWMILELYRRGTLSSGKAAQLLAMARVDFINYASRLGLPYFDMTEDEWNAEREYVDRL